jgi:predicted metal-dependent enzyme (double-stranded beta helix superfamily)
MFDLERFVEECCAAVEEDPTHKAVSELATAALSDPSALIEALGEPDGPALKPLYVSDKLTILNTVWAPGLIVPPHNHNMWAMIGVYGGREDNIFWRRLPDVTGRIEAAGAKSLSTGDVAPLGADIIHSVSNPTSKLSGALHIYGGDFFEEERSEWDPDALDERPLDMDRVRAQFS